MYKIWGKNRLLNKNSLMIYLEQFGIADNSIIELLERNGFVNAGNMRIMKIKF
jgi:hypothetical protein